MFEKIKNDPYIQEIYEKVRIYESVDENAWGTHDLKHVLNVVDIVAKILSQLGYDDEYIDSAKIAALLHDIGCTIGKDNHAERGYEIAKEYFSKSNFKLKYEEEILTAIKNHSEGFNSTNIMVLTLIFADKIDLTKSRVTKVGATIPGMRQLLFIDEIVVDILTDEIIVKFVINKGADRKELEEYYFIPKVFKSIDCFAEKLNKKAKVLWNSDLWILNKSQNKGIK